MAKKNKELIALVAVLSLLSGYLIFDKALTTADTDDTVNSDQRQNIPENLKVITGDYADSATTVVLHNGQVYISFEPCSIGFPEYNGAYETFCSLVDTTLDSYKNYEFENFEFESLSLASSYRLLDSKFLGLQLDVSDVKSVYPVLHGQDVNYDSQGLALVKNDGSLTVISFEDIVTNHLTPTPTELTNIVGVENRMELYGMVTIAIDDSGNEVSLYDYFFKD